jgi:hypothetical protein
LSGNDPIVLDPATDIMKDVIAARSTVNHAPEGGQATSSSSGQALVAFSGSGVIAVCIGGVCLVGARFGKMISSNLPFPSCRDMGAYRGAVDVGTSTLRLLDESDCYAPSALDIRKRQ